jgi:hypothetical protein
MEKGPKQEFAQFNEEKIAELTIKLDSARATAKAAGKEIYMKFFKKWGSFGDHLRTNYPDCQTYRLFHVLSGSGVDEGQCDKFDFPDEDSVEQFINKLAK